ncbi:MAG: response regulator transcription factor [Geminicoccaceae bacterium]
MTNAVVGELRITGLRFVITLQDQSTPDARNAVDLLTKRELQIALLVAAGKVNKQIAHRLGISAYTVSSYLKRIFCKLNCRTRAEMAVQVIETMGQSRSNGTISDN